MTDHEKRLITRMRSVFGLTSHPFAKGLDSPHIFRTDSFNQALDRLRYLGDRHGTGAVFGAPGTGKSTLIQSSLGSLGKATHAICYVDFSSCSIIDSSSLRSLWSLTCASGMLFHVPSILRWICLASAPAPGQTMTAMFQ